MVKLNKPLVPGHMSSLVLDKSRPVLRCGVLD